MVNSKHTIWPQDFRMLLKQTNDQNMQCKLRSQVGWSVLWKRNWKKLTCNVPCVRFSQRRANCRWEGLQHEKFCPASWVTIAGIQFALIWSWVDIFFAVCCLQRLPELLPRDENATPPIPENRAHGLVGYMVKGWIGTYLFSDHLVKYINRKTEA